MLPSAVSYRQRKGLVPLLVIGSVVLLILFIAVVRAAASARGEQKGALCFLSKLGIQIGEGCGTAALKSSSAVTAALNDLVEATPRVKDVPASTAVAAAANTNAQDKAANGHRKLMQGPWMLFLNHSWWPAAVVESPL